MVFKDCMKFLHMCKCVSFLFFQIMDQMFLVVRVSFSFTYMVASIFDNGVLRPGWRVIIY